MLSKRLLKQFAIPNCAYSTYVCTWNRGRDLFGDDFKLVAEISEFEINFCYSHTRGDHEKRDIWRFTLSTQHNDRAKITESQNIEPKLKTIQRSIEIIGNIHEQLQANPAIRTEAILLNETHLPNTAQRNGLRYR